MLPVSAEFLAAVRSSHTVVPRARVITPAATGVDPAGTDLLIVDGTVTLDATADVRGTLDLGVIAPWPTAMTTADLVPYGTEVAVSRGVVFGNGDVERAPLGIYRITMVEQSDAPAGALRITGSDRMQGVIEARLLAPVQYAATTPVGTVVANLVGEVYPSVVIQWDDATNLQQLGRAAVAEEDRYGFLNELVTSLGKVWFFDYRGILVIRTPPAATTAPVWTVDAGADGVLVSASRALNRENVFNAVVAVGEALDDAAPPYGVAYDMNPASVTYWLGPFGKVPRPPYSSPLITTNAQAAAAASKILAESLGLPYSVDFTAVANPALEPLDVVEVVYPPVLGRSPAVRRERHVIDRVTVGLSAATLTAGTRLTTGGV